MTLRTFRSLMALTMITLLASPFIHQPVALAASVVGDGKPASCTEQALTTALSSGGQISFNCGPEPYTITLTNARAIGATTTLNGADRITLSGGDKTRLLLINSNATLTLDHITIEHGFYNGDGGAIFNSGTLYVSHSILRDNVATSGGSGGAIVSYGPLTITDSELYNNRAGNGGALYPRWSAGQTIIRNSVLRNNATTSTTDGWGGAILIWDAASASFENSRLLDNTARSGGAIYSFAGKLALSNSVVRGNSAELNGGAIYNAFAAGNATIVDSTIDGNRVKNADGEGGAIYNQGSLALTGAASSGNQARQGGGISNYGTAALINSTLSGNSSRRGGGIYNHEGGDTSVGFSTLYANTAAEQGGNLYSEFGGVALNGTIVASGSCAGQSPLSYGYNLEAANTCAFTGTTDLRNVDPRLQPLDDNGGPTATHLPLANSPVINAGGAQCPATDQRGLARPQANACDIGAVEMLPGNTACGGAVDVAADTTIDSARPQLAADGTKFVRIARNPQGETNALLKFDLAGRLSSHSTILSATLELPIVSSTSTMSDVIEAQGVRGHWVDGVTWNTRPAVQASYGQTVAGLGVPMVQIDLTTLVTHWATGAVTETSVLLRPGLAAMDLRLKSREGSKPGPRLLIRCADAPEQIPADATAVNQRQRVAFQKLQTTSTETLTLQIDRGAIRYAAFDIKVPAVVGTDALAQAEWFLNTYRDVLRLDASTDELQHIRRSDDGLSLFFRQLHNSIPIYGAELVVHIDGKGRVDGLGGNYLPGINLDAQPTLSAAEAATLATTASPGEDEVLGDTQLRYFNGRLLDLDEDRTTLAWQVNLRTTDGDKAFLIDAHTGAILFQESRHNKDFELDLENGNNELPKDLCGPFDDDDVSANFSADARRVDTNMRQTYNYWRGTFGRDSYDNDGEQIEVDVNVGGPANAAYMGCDIFVFSNGYTTLDTVAHEFSHAVDANESNLIYQNQSGALDESFADIWGHFVDNNDWQLGEDLPGGAVRDMSNPPAFGDPDTMANYNPTTADNGGVHTNSGINNKAAFLITDGGTHNGFQVQGLGQPNAQRLFDKVFTACLWSSAQMIDARNCAVTKAQELGLRVCTVRNAYASVGLGQGDRDCDNIEDNVDSDADGDGTPDFRDNCQNLFNPGQNNVDRDALGDDCDPDIDGDGVANVRANGTSLDNCRYAANPGQADTDRDGEGDACDDRDADGHIDVQDNCPDLFNDQSDVDRDGRGDVCDLDIDNDGKLNAADNCAYVANAGQENRDGDAYGDACDGCPDLNNADNGDVDHDGLGNPCDPDADNDGICSIGGPLTGLPGVPPGGCVAGPTHVRPEGADNCPLVVNPDQVDRDENGLGIACDFPELEELVKSAKKYNDRVQFREPFPVRIPLNFCPQCGEQYLPHDFRTEIVLQIPSVIQARVVNSNGLIVARPRVSAGITRLQFNPAPFAGNALRLGIQGLAGTQAAPVTLAPAADDMNYYLELIPSPNVDPKRVYPVSATITDNVPDRVYLPTVRR